MIADGDKRTLLELIQHLLVVDSERGLELIFYQMACEFRSGCVTPCSMNAIHFINLQKMKYASDEFIVSLQFRNEADHIIHSDGIGMHIKIGKIGFYFAIHITLMAISRRRHCNDAPADLMVWVLTSSLIRGAYLGLLTGFKLIDIIFKFFAAAEHQFKVSVEETIELLFVSSIIIGDVLF